MKCSVCNKPLKKTKALYHYTESGLDNVYLGGIDVFKCAKCGNIEAKIPRIEELHMIIAKSIISQQQRLNNKEIRYLRKYIGIKANELAKILHIHKSTLSRWEAGKDKIGDANDRLLRLLVIGYMIEKHPLLFAAEIIKKLVTISLDVSKKEKENRIHFDKNLQTYSSFVA